MQRLFEFLYKYRAFFIFLILEVLCGWMVVSNNTYQGASFFNSSNAMASSVMETTTSASDYLNLGSVNQELAKENAELKALLSQLEKSKALKDSIPLPKIDSALVNQYELRSAKLINNSVRRFNNFMTLDKGSDDGIEPGMGVISANGVVGRVKSVSEHYATVISLLHTSMSVSSRITSSNTLCTVKWDGRDPLEADVLYVPRHINVSVGDTIVTSGFNAIYPDKTLIGTISEVEMPESDAFIKIRVRLATDFYTLSYVYVVKNKLKQEKDLLEKASGVNDED